MSSNADDDQFAQLLDLFENAPCGHLLTTVEGHIVRANETFLSMTGYARNELVGVRRFDELLTPGGRIYYETNLRPLLHMQGHLREISAVIVRADGTRLPILINSVIRMDAVEERARVQTVILDATERRSYERELIVANSRIERLRRATASFASPLDVGAIANAALTELVDGEKADLGVLALVSPTDASLVLVGIRPEIEELTDEWNNLSLDRAEPIARAIESAEAVFVEAGDASQSGLSRLLGDGPPATRVCLIPLFADGRTIALLCLASRTRRTFEHDERRFLLSFSALCAQALERVRLHAVSEQLSWRASFLAALGSALDEKIGLVERAQSLVDTLVPELADFATVEIPRLGSRPVAGQHADPELLAPLLDLRERATVGDQKAHSLARARTTGEPQLLSEIPEALYCEYGLPEDQLETLRLLAPKSYVGLPLHARGELVGSLMLAMAGSPRRFKHDDLPFYLAIADRAAVGLENARLLEHERSVAHRLQTSLLPASMPSDERVGVSAWYRPSTELVKIGGDWYDAFLLSRDRLAFVVGDVVGHDFDAALIMGQLRTALRAFALFGDGPAASVERLSRFVESVPGALGTALVYAELDLETRDLRWTSAGNLPPILVEPGNAPRALWDARSHLLGATRETAPAEATIRLADGATVILVTDGLVERRNRSIDERFEELLDRLGRTTAAPDDGFLDELVESLLEGAEQVDDICILSVSLTSPTQHASVSSSEPSSGSLVVRTS